MLHDARDQNILAVAKRVNIHLGSVFEKAIYEDGSFHREAHGFLHVTANGFFVIRDYHRASAQHIAGTHQYRKTELQSYLAGFLDAGGGSVCRRRDSEIVKQFAKQLAILGEI